jgi:hypothetical protein
VRFIDVVVYNTNRQTAFSCNITKDCVVIHLLHLAYHHHHHLYRYMVLHKILTSSGAWVNSPDCSHEEEQEQDDEEMCHGFGDDEEMCDASGDDTPVEEERVDVSSWFLAKEGMNVQSRTHRIFGDDGEWVDVQTTANTEEPEGVDVNTNSVVVVVGVEVQACLGDPIIEDNLCPGSGDDSVDADELEFNVDNTSEEGESEEVSSAVSDVAREMVSQLSDDDEEVLVRREMVEQLNDDGEEVLHGAAEEDLGDTLLLPVEEMNIMPSRSHEICGDGRDEWVDIQTTVNTEESEGVDVNVNSVSTEETAGVNVNANSVVGAEVQDCLGVPITEDNMLSHFEGEDHTQAKGEFTGMAGELSAYVKWGGVNGDRSQFSALTDELLYQAKEHAKANGGRTAKKVCCITDTCNVCRKVMFVRPNMMYRWVWGNGYDTYVICLSVYCQVLRRKKFGGPLEGGEDLQDMVFPEVVTMQGMWSEKNINYQYLRRYLMYCHLNESKRAGEIYPPVSFFDRMTNFETVKFFIDNVDQTSATKVRDR